MLKSRVILSRLCLLAIAALVFSVAATGRVNADDVGNFCPFGTCVISNPVFVNVYWAPDEATWNSDVAALGPADGTVARMDALMRAVVHSNYFAGLAQYSVGLSSTRPSLFAGSCGAAPANIDQAHDHIGDFATCIVNAHPELNNDNTVLNVFIPPQTVPSSPTADFCHVDAAEHDEYGSPVKVTFNPVACNGSIALMFGQLAHEMVEAATDPNPSSITGWKEAFDGEIGDQCENSNPNRFPTFLYATVSQYWSNAIHGCVQGFSITPPTVSAVTACGAGSAMQIRMSGSFGPAPWDFSPASTMYLQASISGSHSWGAGNIFGFPADTVGFGQLTWTPTAITMNGFDGNYGTTLSNGNRTIVSPGDTITMNVWSPSTGQSTTRAVTVPSATQIISWDSWLDNYDPHRARSWIQVNDSAMISARLVDASGCGIEGQHVIMSDSQGEVTPPYVNTTASDGHFTYFWAPRGVAGPRTMRVTSPITATTTMNVHPIAEQLDHTIGTVSGGQPVTLAGDGFGAGVTAVAFSANGTTHNAAIGHVSGTTSVSFTTPTSPIGGTGDGMADVVALVNNVPSLPLSYQYVVAGKPVLTFYPSPCVESSQYTQLAVNAYNADGTPANEQIALTAATPVFSVSGSFVSSTTVTPGTTLTISGLGPVTATVVGNPGLTVTDRGQATGPRQRCFKIPFEMLWPILPVWGPGPVENIGLNPIILEANQGVLWGTNPKAAGAMDNAYITLATAGISPARIANTLRVGELSVLNLRSAVRAQPYAFVHNAREYHHIAFDGPNFAIGMRAMPITQLAMVAKEGPQLGGIVKFAIPKDQNPANYRILERSAHTGNSWTDTGATIVRHHSIASLVVKTTGMGIFALAHVTK